MTIHIVFADIADLNLCQTFCVMLLFGHSAASADVLVAALDVVIVFRLGSIGCCFRCLE